jgi:hypothetical protein
MRRPEWRVVALYAWLTTLYPTPFRAAFAHEMQTVFAMLVAETAPDGRWALLRLAVRELGGLIASLIHEHLDARRNNPMIARLMRQLLTAATTLLLGLLVGLTFVFDLAIGEAVTRWAVAATLGAVGVLFGVILYRVKRTTFPLVILGVFLTASVLIWSFDWNSRKPFLRDLYQVRSGMHIAQVDQVMVGYMRFPARFGSVGETNRVSYRHTTQGWGDADIGVIHYDKNGQVSQVEFLPD